ncbi:hypothetical protein O181_110173 [Austropuccinia psidii MF-1]|uniref:Peptidase A2 domain-containing protein n=1 Tax=Austropuccinia psidii MF-1 TaxID=1389203 RepID=A0A9Q3JW46_9BASI|nr:hypothetical protein [Austropuccinia psidii MF-1]
MTQYKKFIGEYESIINYLRRYQYIQGDINHNQEILASLSSSVQESIYKEMIKDKAMVQALDGGYIIPRLEILKLYIEQDLEAKVLIQQKEFSQPKSQEKKARFEEESWEEVLKQMKDLTQKIQNPQLQGHQSKDSGKETVKEVFNQLKHLSKVVESPNKIQEGNNQDQKVTQNSQPFRPRYPLPPISFGYQTYAPAQMAPRQLLKCYYCLEEGHSAIRCNHLTEDLEKIIVAKCGGTYIFPNFQRVPPEGPKSAKELTRQRAARQECQSQIQQEDKNETHKPFKRKIKGAYHKEDEAEEEIRVLFPTKYKKTQEGKEVDDDNIKIISRNKNKEGLRQELQKMELKDKVKSTANNPKLIIEHVMEKILEQKINLTLEEILSMSPTFIDKLQNLTTQEKEVIKSVNTSNIQERLLSVKLWDYDTPRLHYACPLGFMEVFFGREEYPTMALVDTGSETNIIPEEIQIQASLTSRKLNMNLRGIGGHITSFVRILEFTPITMITGEEKEIHLFIAKGAVHTILGRQFLADNNVKLEFSHKQGKIFSYPEQDGRQLCLPICNPQAMGWQISPPRGMELCASSEIGKWSIHGAE